MNYHVLNNNFFYLFKVAENDRYSRDCLFVGDPSKYFDIA